MNYNLPLLEKYEKEMPQNLSVYDQYKWREHKVKELLLKKAAVMDDATGTIRYLEFEEKSAENDSFVQKTADAASKNSDSLLNDVRTPKIKQRDVEMETVREIPKSVIAALRRIFASNAGKTDLLSAAVYIFTNGDCEITDKAMALVKEYSKQDSFFSIEDRIKKLEAASKRQLQLLQSIELCTCYNTFDRRYGSKEPRTRPELTEFREEGTLDMLSRLREQAYDQQMSDNQDRGRQIYNQTKDNR